MNGLVQEGHKLIFLVKFFSFKSAWIFACAFQLSSKPFPCIILACLHFVSEKNEDKIIYIENNERNKAEHVQEHFSKKKIQENVFLLS